MRIYAVSVVMPVYNAGNHLARAVESILAQRGVNLELVCIDDGSTDGSGDRLETWARRDRRLVVIRAEHRGIVAALNQGLATARHPFLARMDADDVSHPDRLRLQAELLDSDPRLDVVGCLVRSFPRPAVAKGFRLYEEWLNSLVRPEEIAREIYVESPIAHPSALMRASEARRLGGYREVDWAEDYDLWLRYHQAGYRLAKVPRILFAWRMHAGRLSFVDPRCTPERFFRCKAHFLARETRVQRGPLLIWGAGVAGRRLSRRLIELGVAVDAFVDIDPRKIGRTRYGRPIGGPETLARYPDRFILVAVGTRGARPLIREQLTALGRIEGRDYLFCA
ncbi:MAG: glycosyltransferase [Candidatus Desulforudis sp.]|nr:glycosyltransferase [Desulforudis sp.]